MRVKVSKIGEEREVIYQEERWEILASLRELAREVMSSLMEFEIDSMAHGSIARGDVHRRSDVDVFIPAIVPSYLVEMALEKFQIIERELIQAAPWHLPKGRILLENGVEVTFPISKPKEIELEFYRFGGAITLREISEKRRVPGIDKRLMVILPTKKGHREFSVIGREKEASKLVGVSQDIIRERIQVLTRRDRIGRTGIYLRRGLKPEENFEEVFLKICSRDPNVRRRYDVLGR